MTAYLVKRLAHSALVLFAVLTLVFLLGHGIGDPAKIILPPEHTQQQYLETRQALGLDDPLVVQFGRAVGSWLNGTFGTSLWMRLPALPVALERVPATLYLAAVTMLYALPIAVLLGTLSAVWPRSVLDRGVLARADADPDRRGPARPAANLGLWRAPVRDPAGSDPRIPSDRPGRPGHPQRDARRDRQALRRDRPRKGPRRA